MQQRVVHGQGGRSARAVAVMPRPVWEVWEVWEVWQVWQVWQVWGSGGAQSAFLRERWRDPWRLKGLLR